MSDTTETRRMPIAGWQFLAMLVRAGLVEHRPIRATLKLEVSHLPELAYEGYQLQPITNENREEMAVSMQWAAGEQDDSPICLSTKIARSPSVLRLAHELYRWLRDHGFTAAIGRDVEIIADVREALTIKSTSFGDELLASPEFAEKLAGMGFAPIPSMEDLSAGTPMFDAGVAVS